MARDRQNWAGKTPKRQLFHGPPSPFDWRGEAEKIMEANEKLLERSHSCASDYSIASRASGFSSVSIDSAPAASPSPSVKEKFDPAWLGTCHQCKVAVWVGPKDAAVKGISPAYPINTDWTQAENQEPYCHVCWGLVKGNSYPS